MHLHMHMHTYLSLNYAARSSPRAHTDSHHGRRDEHDNGIASARNMFIFAAMTPHTRRVTTRKDEKTGSMLSVALTGTVAIEDDIADMTIDKNMRKRRAVHVAEPPAVEGEMHDLGESVLRRIPNAAHSVGEQVTGAFTRERAEARRGRMLISPTSLPVVPATPATTSDVPPATAQPLFDALPAELVCAVAASLCTAAGLVAMGRTCRAWRLAVGGQGAPLW